jgi:hypothetical protein
MVAEQRKPFPVVLDLTDDRAYSTLTLALTGYAESARADAADEEQSQEPNELRVENLNTIAVIAESLLEDVERQLAEAEEDLS